jgi:hypothetical protein
MSCIWIEAQGGWTARTVPVGKPLTGEDLGVPGIALLVLPRQGAVLLTRPEVWVRVNGEPVLGGMRIIEHKDEVLAGDIRFVFSQQGVPVVVGYTPVAGGRLPTCPVCRGVVREASASVQCPGCGRWFHQEGAKTCWSYAPTCRFCNHPTSFDDESAWRPDREEAVVR